MSMPGTALLLVALSEDGQFTIQQDTIGYLRQQKHSIGVVAVAGLYRTGKSYLLNLLTKPSNAKNGFAVGSSVNACTKGIWIWSEPSYDEEKDIWVYYIDTEGLGSTSRSETHDSRIFALSILLSSYFIYNSRGVIDNQALEDLSLVVSISRTIKVKSTKGNRDEKESGDILSDHFPCFLWVLRDFSLKLVDNKGQRITSRSYLENCLIPQTGFSEEIESRNRIRRHITDFFHDRDCVTLIRPVEDEEILRHLSDYSLSELRPEFRKQMESLLTKISKNVRAKKVFGRNINGEMFCTLLESYVDAFNSGGAPEIKGAWSRVLANQCNDARKHALDIYEREIVSILSVSQARNNDTASSGPGLMDLLPVDIATLINCHEIAKTRAKECFRSKVMDSRDETANQGLISLKHDLRKRLTASLEFNGEASLNASRATLQSVLKELSDHDDMKHSSIHKIGVDVKDIYSSLSSYGRVIDNIENELKDPHSPEGFHVASSLILNDFMEHLMLWASRVSEAFRMSENSLQKNIHKLELNFTTVSSTLQAKRALYSSQTENDTRAATALKEKIDMENTKYEEILLLKQQDITRYETMLNDLGLLHQKSISTLETRIKDLREKLKHERNVVLEEQSKLGEEKSILRAKSRSAVDARDEEMKQLADSVARQETHIKNLTQEVKDLASKHQEELNKKSQDHLNETTILSRNLDNEIDALSAQLKADSRRDCDNKLAEVKRMQDMIKEKESKLIGLGIDPGDSLISLSTIRNDGNSLADPQALSGSKTRKNKKTGKKKSSSCNQS